MAQHDLTTILSSLLANIPRVEVGAHLNHTNFLIGNKVFAYIQGNGVVLKLPKEKAQELVETEYAALLVMGKRFMQEWVVIRHDDPQVYQQDEALFKEAIAFVASKAC